MKPKDRDNVTEDNVKIIREKARKTLKLSIFLGQAEIATFTGPANGQSYVDDQWFKDAIFNGLMQLNSTLRTMFR